MFPTKCKAVLKTINNDILETGFVSYSAKGQSLDFTSQFVPILQIDSKVKVVCTENNVITHVFSGDVYLSSPKLLRVISLKCAFISGAEKVLCADIPFRAQILLPIFRHKLFTNKLTYKWQDCDVQSISLHGAAIKCPEILSEFEDKITIRIAEPIFSKPTEIHLHTGEKGLMFGNNTKYRYKIEKLNKRAETELRSFIKQVNINILGNIEMIDEASLY